MFPATQEQATAWQEYFGKGGDSLASNPSQVDRAFIVDGAMKMEWVEEKTAQEIVDTQGDSFIYEERVYSGYNWMCFECKLVWDKQHQAKNCGSRGHATSYEDTYGVKEVRNGVPTGPNMYTITREAIRREKSTDTPPVAPALQVEEPAQVTGYDPKLEADKPWSQVVKEREIRECRVCTSLIANHLAFGRQPNPSDSTLCECCEEKPAPQADMTSEQLWDSMQSVTQPTITTTWN
tara:strand:- start:551 stop:1258 length:708 start_codon:yes stop_codon:yes gene_type:complete